MSFGTLQGFQCMLFYGEDGKEGDINKNFKYISIFYARFIFYIKNLASGGSRPLGPLIINNFNRVLNPLCLKMHPWIFKIFNLQFTNKYLYNGIYFF